MFNNVYFSDQELRIELHREKLKNTPFAIFIIPFKVTKHRPAGKKPRRKSEIFNKQRYGEASVLDWRMHQEEEEGQNKSAI